mmetsp:Transcript_13891/g.21060  ORF Transcript_13891/g.21060 Transcript_13891/m.21060 type:complete len:151 (+) Transcript_13891:71-523(+)
MAGLLGAYEDSSEDDDAPSALAKAAAATTPIAPASSPPTQGDDDDEEDDLHNVSEDFAVELPPSPTGEPDEEMVLRVRDLQEKRKRGISLKNHIQGSRDWSNPYILDRVIKVFAINEYGSNLPKDVFDPDSLGGQQENDTGEPGHKRARQ